MIGDRLQHDRGRTLWANHRRLSASTQRLGSEQHRVWVTVLKSPSISYINETEYGILERLSYRRFGRATTNLGRE